MKHLPGFVDQNAALPPILHLKLFHPLDDHYGLSSLEAAAVEHFCERIDVDLRPVSRAVGPVSGQDAGYRAEPDRCRDQGPGVEHPGGEHLDRPGQTQAG